MTNFKKSMLNTKYHLHNQVNIENIGISFTPSDWLSYWKINIYPLLQIRCVLLYCCIYLWANFTWQAQVFNQWNVFGNFTFKITSIYLWANELNKIRKQLSFIHTSHTFHGAYTKVAALVHNRPYSYIETRDCTCKQAVMATLPGVNGSQRFSDMRHIGISWYNQPGPASIPYWLINRHLELQIQIYFPHILDYNFQNLMNKCKLWGHFLEWKFSFSFKLDWNLFQ